MARRLIEHGVRFVQIYQRGWDLHSFECFLMIQLTGTVDSWRRFTLTSASATGP